MSGVIQYFPDHVLSRAVNQEAQPGIALPKRAPTGANAQSLEARMQNLRIQHERARNRQRRANLNPQVRATVPAYAPQAGWTAPDETVGDIAMQDASRSSVVAEFVKRLASASSCYRQPALAHALFEGSRDVAPKRLRDVLTELDYIPLRALASTVHYAVKDAPESDLGSAALVRGRFLVRDNLERVSFRDREVATVLPIENDVYIVRD